MDIIKQLRQQAEEIAKEGHMGWGNTMLEAADRLERKDADLWAIDAELKKAGLEPYKYKTFAECVAVLRARAEQQSFINCAQCGRLVPSDTFTPQSG